MELSRKTLLRAYPVMPTQVGQRVDETLVAIHRQAPKAPPKRYAIRLRFAAVVMALALLLAAIGVAAGIHLGVFDFMERVSGQSGVLPEATGLVQTNLGSLDLPHTTLTAEQAVYDGGNLRVMYAIRQKDATAPLTEEEWQDESGAFRKALAADGVNTGGCDWFRIDGVEYTMTNGSFDDAMIGEGNGELLCYLDVQLASAGIVPQSDFTVQLPLVRRDGSYTTLDFTVKADAPAKELPVQHSKDATVTVLSASFSPVRAYVNLRIEMEDDAALQQADEVFADWRDAVLTDAQGNEIGELEELLPSNLEKGKHVDYSFTFLPIMAEEAYLAPTVLDENNDLVVDMTRALKVK